MARMKVKLRFINIWYWLETFDGDEYFDFYDKNFDDHFLNQE